MVDVEGAAARERPPEHDAKPGRLCLQPTGDRGFESCSLHRRVTCEPDFLDQGADGATARADSLCGGWIVLAARSPTTDIRAGRPPNLPWGIHNEARAPVLVVGALFSF